MAVITSAQVWGLFFMLTLSFASILVPPVPFLKAADLYRPERLPRALLQERTVYTTVCAAPAESHKSSTSCTSTTTPLPPSYTESTLSTPSTESPTTSSPSPSSYKTSTPLPSSYKTSTPLPPSSTTSTHGGPRPSCPAVWTQIVEEMKQVFAGCNSPARFAIRFGFHDAAGYSSLTTPYGPASGGADGSLLLSDAEVGRPENAPLPAAQAQMKPQWARFQDQNVSAADFVQMSALMAVRSCGGPAYTMLVGREDDSTPCPEGMLPAAFGANATHGILTQLWAEKGINERELAALIGAHTVSQAFAQQTNGIPAGSPQDSTDTVWDTKYFQDARANTAPAGVYRFEADQNLAAANTTTGQAFAEFANNFEAWNQAYAGAAYKMSLMGIPQSKIASMADCSSLAL